MASDDCPSCGEHIGPALGYHAVGINQEVPHANRDCPRCGRPLIRFSEGVLATGWRINEAEETRQKLAED